MERELTPTATPTKAPTVAPTMTPYVPPSCEDVMRNGSDAPLECVWATATVAAMPTTVACLTPVPRERCVLFPAPTSAPLIPPTGGEVGTE